MASPSRFIRVILGTSEIGRGSLSVDDQVSHKNGVS